MPEELEEDSSDTGLDEDDNSDLRGSLANNDSSEEGENKRGLLAFWGKEILPVAGAAGST